MEKHDPVTLHQLELAVILQLEIAKEIASTVLAIQVGLEAKDILSAELREKIRGGVEALPLMRRLQDTLDRIRETAPLEEVLRDYKGPIQ